MASAKIVFLMLRNTRIILNLVWVMLDFNCRFQWNMGEHQCMNTGLEVSFWLADFPCAAASPGKGFSLQNGNRNADKLQSYDLSTKG